MKDSDSFELSVTYKSEERSKDSNGANKIFKLTGEKLLYTESYWGFKSEKMKSLQSSTKLSEKDHKAIFSFISESKLNCNHQKAITIDKRFSFTTYTYIIECKSSENTTTYQIQSNDLNPNHKSWDQVKGLFNLLKNIFRIGSS